MLIHRQKLRQRSLGLCMQSLYKVSQLPWAADKTVLALKQLGAVQVLKSRCQAL